MHKLLLEKYSLPVQSFDLAPSVAAFLLIQTSTSGLAFWLYQVPPIVTGLRRFVLFRSPTMPADNRRARVSADKPLITWTRFYLPRNQEWPVWSVDHDDIHAGPLIDLEGCCRLGLARMVDNPDQAAYIIGKLRRLLIVFFLSDR